jgi:hypothetical protein
MMIANKKLKTSCKNNMDHNGNLLTHSNRHEVYRIILGNSLYEAPIGDSPQVNNTPKYVSIL